MYSCCLWIGADSRSLECALEAEATGGNQGIPLAAIHTARDCYLGRASKPHPAIPILPELLESSEIESRDDLTPMVAEYVRETASCVQALQDDHHVGRLH